MGGEICDENSNSVDSVLVFGKGWLRNVPNRSHFHARASRARTSRESKRARSDAKDDARAVRRNRDRAVREAQDVLTMFATARVVPLDV